MKTDWHGLIVEYTIIDGGWQGDASLPNGTRKLPDYIDATIYAPDGEDITDYLTDAVLDELHEEILGDGIDIDEVLF